MKEQKFHNLHTNKEDMPDFWHNIKQCNEAQRVLNEILFSSVKNIAQNISYPLTKVKTDFTQHLAIVYNLTK